MTERNSYMETAEQTIEELLREDLTVADRVALAQAQATLAVCEEINILRLGLNDDAERIGMHLGQSREAIETLPRGFVALEDERRNERPKGRFVGF